MAKTPPITRATLARIMPGRRIIAPRFKALGEGTDGGGGATNYLRTESRARALIGKSRVSQIQLVYANWKILASGTGEAAGANPITLDAALEPSTSSFSVPVLFNGQSSITLPPGATVISDPAPFDCDANGYFYARTGLSVASAGQTWPCGWYRNVSLGEIIIEKTSTTSYVNSNGALPVDGGAGVGVGYAPIAVIGLADTDIISIVWFGDSISVGAGAAAAANGDIGGSANVGFMAQGIIAASTIPIPYCAMARSGDAMIGCNLQYGPRKRLVLPFATHGIIEHGTNDCNSAGTLANMQARLIEIVKAMRSRGLRHVSVCTICPKTTSTDNWATAANQTPVAGSENGGVRSQYNAWLRAGADGLVDAVFDVGSLGEDPANPGKWLSNGTANYATVDGTHPTQAIHTLMAAVVTARVQTF